MNESLKLEIQFKPQAAGLPLQPEELSLLDALLGECLMMLAEEEIDANDDIASNVVSTVAVESINS